MKIVHISPNAVYNDYWGYQDNLLPKYQRKLGHEVTVIVPNEMYVEGKVVSTAPSEYVLDDGVRVIRLKKHRYKSNLFYSIASKLDVFDLLVEIKPDFIFFHGLVSTTIYDAVRYKKKINNKCKIVQDNHLDFFNHTGVKLSFKQKILRCFYRRTVRKCLPFVERVYGVTPWRKEYAERYFKVPNSKTDVLIMGADDEKIDFLHRNEIRESLRKEYDISEDTFLIVTGGKIDSQKKITDLMEACSGLQKVKLLIFGKVQKGLNKFEDILSHSDNIIYIGWIPSDRVYDYFLSADLVCFPGSHSVLWEQACASKVPCACAHFSGMEHVNNGGNCILLDEDNASYLRKTIEELIFTEKYFSMREVAQSSKTDVFLYSKIAEKSLECWREK